MELPAINAMRVRRGNCPAFPLCAPAKTGFSTITSFNAQLATLSVSPAHRPTFASLAIQQLTANITLLPKHASACRDISRPQPQSSIALPATPDARPVKAPIQTAPFATPQITEF